MVRSRHLSHVTRHATRDRLTKDRRSWNMSRIRGKHTTPEKVVRSLLRRLGYRFRLHVLISGERDVSPFASRFLCYFVVD